MTKTTLRIIAVLLALLTGNAAACPLSGEQKFERASNETFRVFCETGFKTKKSACTYYAEATMYAFNENGGNASPIPIENFWPPASLERDIGRTPIVTTASYMRYTNNVAVRFNGVEISRSELLQAIPTGVEVVDAATQLQVENAVRIQLKVPASLTLEPPIDGGISKALTELGKTPQDVAFDLGLYYQKTVKGKTITKGHSIPALKVTKNGKPALLLGLLNEEPLSIEVDTDANFLAGLHKYYATPSSGQANVKPEEFKAITISVPISKPAFSCCVL